MKANLLWNVKYLDLILLMHLHVFLFHPEKLEWQCKMWLVVNIQNHPQQFITCLERHRVQTSSSMSSVKTHPASLFCTGQSQGNTVT